jgi:hypothetical protein
MPGSRDDGQHGPDDAHLAAGGQDANGYFCKNFCGILYITFINRI